jgi:hypothetical protein
MSGYLQISMLDEPSAAAHWLQQKAIFDMAAAPVSRARFLCTGVMHPALVSKEKLPRVSTRATWALLVETSRYLTLHVYTEFRTHFAHASPLSSCRFHHSWRQARLESSKVREKHTAKLPTHPCSQLQA